MVLNVISRVCRSGFPKPAGSKVSQWMVRMVHSQRKQLGFGRVHGRHISMPSNRPRVVRLHQSEDHVLSALVFVQAIEVLRVLHA